MKKITPILVGIILSVFMSLSYANKVCHITADVTNTFDKPVQIVLTSPQSGSIINQRLNPGQKASGAFDVVFEDNRATCPPDRLSHWSLSTGTDDEGYTLGDNVYSGDASKQVFLKIIDDSFIDDWMIYYYEKVEPFVPDDYDPGISNESYMLER